MFVVSENGFHHKAVLFDKNHFDEEVNCVNQEDLSMFDSSEFYCALLNSEIIASIKITLWNKQVELPLEKIFNIQCSEIIPGFDQSTIWHIGRFAISKEKNPLGSTLFKQLLTIAIFTMCINSNSLMLAECDRKLLRVLNSLGIRTNELAKGKEYLGSETIPILSKSGWLEVFLDGNEYISLAREITGIYDYSKSRYFQNCVKIDKIKTIKKVRSMTNF